MKFSSLFCWMPKRNMRSCLFLLFLLFFVFVQFNENGRARASPLTHPGPTLGFKSLPLNDSNFDIQKPYNLLASERYSFNNGIHKFWVLSTDKPLSLKSPTAPRTEIRIRGYDYSSGAWQFEGHVYIPSGTSGVCIMQVFDFHRRASTLMLRVYNGALMYYRGHIITDDVYDRWLRINVIHTIATRLLGIFVDGKLKLTVNDRNGGQLYYFKCGVYTQNYSSYFMESRWKGIRVLKLAD